MTGFGDIMSHRSTMNGVDGDYSPLERIVITANGNLQRILSAYFNSNVTVNILKNERISVEEIPLIFDRKVELVCFGMTKCIAESLITITDTTIIDLIVSKKVGLGQLFRYLNMLPEFTLLHVERLVNGFSRTYLLKIQGMECRIKETFPSDLFESTASNQSIDLERVNGTATYQGP
jgi:hypothetical protein